MSCITVPSSFALRGSEMEQILMAQAGGRRTSFFNVTQHLARLSFSQPGLVPNMQSQILWSFQLSPSWLPLCFCVCVLQAPPSHHSFSSAGDPGTCILEDCEEPQLLPSSSDQVVGSGSFGVSCGQQPLACSVGFFRISSDIFLLLNHQLMEY